MVCPRCGVAEDGLTGRTPADAPVSYAEGVHSAGRYSSPDLAGHTGRCPPPEPRRPRRLHRKPGALATGPGTGRKPGREKEDRRLPRPPSGAPGRSGGFEPPSAPQSGGQGRERPGYVEKRRTGEPKADTVRPGWCQPAAPEPFVPKDAGFVLQQRPFLPPRFSILFCLCQEDTSIPATWQVSGK